MGISLPIPSIKSKNLQFSDLAPYKIVSSRDAGHHRESMGLHPTPCIEQAVNRDLRIPAVCLSGFFTIAWYRSLCKLFLPDATPAFRLSLARSYHGSTSPESHIGLQSTIKLSRFAVLGQCPSPIEFGRGHFARNFFELFVNFAIQRTSVLSFLSTNRNPQGWFHIQF